MRIVIGDRLTEDDKIVLKLDRMRGADGTVQQTYLTFNSHETILFEEGTNGVVYKDEILHNKMMDYFFSRKWDNAIFCLIVLANSNTFESRLRNFYNSIVNRIQLYKNTPPPADWDGIYYQPVITDK
jgi:hypothetical protein